MPVELPTSFLENSWTYNKKVKNQIKGTILAAGFGSRLKPLTTHHLPKPLFPIGGKVPIAEEWVRKLIYSGITDISMNLCVHRNTVKRHFVDGLKFGANITYFDEDEPSGTLGGVCKQGLGINSRKIIPGDKDLSADEFKGSTLFVLGGDIVTDFGSEQLEEMYDIHKKAGAAFTVVLFPVPWEQRGEFGTALLDNPESRNSIISKSGRIKIFIEKDPKSPSNLNNTSIYIIEMEFIRFLDSLRTEASLDVKEPFYDFGKHVFPAMSDEPKGISLPKKFILWGIQYDGHWFDVGRKRDYLRVNESLLDGLLKIRLPYEKLPWGYLGMNVDINFSKVNIIPPVVIGNNCAFENKATIGPYAVIGDDWKIMNGVCIKNSVLWERYSFYTKNGVEILAEDRKNLDTHEILRGVKIVESIITGGTIKEDVQEMTVCVLEDGKLEILPIDQVPKGPRA